MVGILGQQVVHCIDQKAGGAAGRVEQRIADVGIDHLDHEGTDLSRGTKLPVERTGTQMHQQIFEYVTLHVRTELAEFEAVEFVDDLLEYVGIDDLQHGIAEVLGHLGLVLGQRGHIRKDFVADEVAQFRAALEAPVAPAITFRLRRVEQLGVATGTAEAGAQFAVRLLFVEQLEEDEVGNLLDVGDRVGHATGP